MSVDLHLTIAGDEAAKATIRARAAKCDPHRVATRVAVPTARHWRNHLAHLPHNKKGYPSTGFWEDAARRVVGVANGGRVELTSDKLGLRQRLHGGTISAINHKYLTIPICAEAYGTRVADWGFENLTLVITPRARFFALWLGNADVQSKFDATVGEKMDKYRARTARMAKSGRTTGVPMSEPITRAVNRFRVSTAFRKPDVIILKGGGNAASRAERHANLKFLFLLVESVEQAGNPDVIPSDLGQVALEAVLEATK